MNLPISVGGSSTHRLFQQRPSPASSTTQQILRAIRAHDYDGPKAESTRLVRAFVQETLSHARRVQKLARLLGGDASGHDVNETVSLARVDTLVKSLKATITGPDAAVFGWVERMAMEARAKGENEISIGKLTPQVAAGLARTGLPDPTTLALHRLASHHSSKTASNRIESVADLVDALLSPRGYKKAMSPQAAEKVIIDMIERRRTPLTANDMPLVKTALKLHAREWGRGRNSQ